MTGPGDAGVDIASGDLGRRGDLSRLRVALCAVFAAHGFIYASWAVRVPAVKEQAARDQLPGQ